MLLPIGKRFSLSLPAAMLSHLCHSFDRYVLSEQHFKHVSCSSRFQENSIHHRSILPPDPNNGSEGGTGTHLPFLCGVEHVGGEVNPQPNTLNRIRLATVSFHRPY